MESVISSAMIQEVRTLPPFRNCPVLLGLALLLAPLIACQEKPSMLLPANTTVVGNLASGTLDNVVFADQQAGADASIKINACRAAATLLAPHVCDARNLGGTQTISQEIDVGDSAQDPFTLILPSQGTWNVTITDGTSCAIKQFSQTVLVGAAPGGAPRMIIRPLNGTTSVKQYYCTDPNPAGGGSYIRASDFMIYNPSVAATTGATAMRIYGLFDNSTYRDITVADYMEYGIHIRGVCCSASFYNLTSNGGFGAGAKPLFLDAVGGLNAEVTLNFFGGSFDHPGSGLNNILIQGNSTTTPMIANFYGTYMESNNRDTTTPLVEVQSVLNVNFTGVTACTLATASTAPIFQLDDSPAIASQVTVTGLSIPNVAPCKHTLPEPKAIKNNITGVNQTSDANGNLSTYSTGLATFAGTSVRASMVIADQGTACANGNLELSAGWGSTATVTEAAGTGQTCQFTLTSAGTGQAANATITDTLPTALPTANTVCTAQLTGGTGMAALSGGGLFINQTTLSAMAPAFTFPGLPVAGSTYFVVIRCGP